MSFSVSALAFFVSWYSSYTWSGWTTGKDAEGIGGIKVQFELRPQYHDWPGNDRKALHVDAEAYAALQRIMDGPPVELADIIPPDVLTELHKPMYGPGTGSAAIQLWGMSVYVDLADKAGNS